MQVSAAELNVAITSMCASLLFLSSIWQFRAVHIFNHSSVANARLETNKTWRLKKKKKTQNNNNIPLSQQRRLTTGLVDAAGSVDHRGGLLSNTT